MLYAKYISIKISEKEIYAAQEHHEHFTTEAMVK